MSGKYVKLLSSLAALAMLAGCNSTSMTSAFSSSPKNETPADTTNKAVVVQGECPQVFLREGTAVFSQYAKPAKKKKGEEAAPPQDPNTLVMQATLDQTTRQCFQTGQGLKVTVVVHARVVLGPMGKPGSSFTLPIRVAATDGDQTLYSELTSFPVTLAPGQTTGQFVFTKENVVFQAPPGSLTKLFAGIDEGPYNTK